MSDIDTAFANLELFGEKIVRGTLLGMTSKIITRSPVDTGRFRNNWIPSFDAPASGTASNANGNPVSNTAQAINKWQVGQTFYLTNNLPYSVRLEFGHSPQAPNGMLRLTLAEYETEMKKAAKL